MKVIIVDDQNIMVSGLTMILSKYEDIEVVGQGSNGEEAIKLCDTVDVDVVLMDIRMPIMNGVEATLKIKENHPEIKILILTTFKDDDFIFGSLKNGASGYLLKDANPSTIYEGIKTVYAGGTLMDPDVARKVVDRLNEGVSMEPDKEGPETLDLTERERDICHFLGEGFNNREIGESMFISEGTVKNHITRILDKLELRDRTQLALFAVKNKI